MFPPYMTLEAGFRLAHYISLLFFSPCVETDTGCEKFLVQINTGSLDLDVISCLTMELGKEQAGEEI